MDRTVEYISGGGNIKKQLLVQYESYLAAKISEKLASNELEEKTNK